MGKYQGYGKYKDSAVEWLGEIPDHWEVKQLKYIKSKEKNAFVDGPFGSNLKTVHFVTDGDAFVIESEFATRGKLIEEGLKQITLDHFLTIQRSSAKGGDIIIAKIGAYFGLNNILPNLSKPAVVSGNSLKLSINTNTCCTKFIHYLLLHLKESGAIDLQVSITAQPALSLGGMNRLQSSIPPLEEQEKIARFLDYKTKQIDELIAKKEALIEKLDEKRTALISHAVTKGLDPNVPMKDSGIEWLGEIPQHWNIISIKRFSEIYDCKHKTVSFIDDGLPVASIAQVQNFYIDLSAAKKTTREEFLDMIEGGREPQNGDIIFSRNATVGASAIVRNDIFCMGQDVCLIRPIKTDSIFLNYNFRAFFIKSQINTYLLGSTFKRINVEEVKNLLICLPTLTEQEKIVTFIEQKTAEIDQQKAKIQQAIEVLKEYRTALITNAVTGKIDVRQVPIP
ncbi:restriction endonuclease subunit S [Nostoc sp. CMAA1605]|uniref:restriction endonuclease subunit S n=1 Tax=Nostoc sp. CMAA1605 TaxID=2055159 RepID=UPI001F39AC27|nr:restriction endonuclease subunit S [Nostoc sp. CMAA1605]MCF4966443.1 restriction endonuclease subunit S [Nostoc sp. CMAA1605]